MRYLFLLCFACLLWSFSPQTTEDSDVMIAFAGKAYAKDVTAVQKYLKKRVWHAVFCDDGKCTLEPTEVSISPVEKTESGDVVMVSVSQERNPIFIVSSPTLEAQEIKHAAILDQMLYPGVARRMPNSEWLMAAGFGEPNDENGKICIKNYLVLLSPKVDKMDSNSKPLLSISKECSGFYPYADWVGDLDGDDKLDFLMSTDYGPVTGYFLLLSGSAKDGVFYDRAAQYIKTEGC
ncbi:MAG: hypothetical protein GY810_22235 [Aureispira sp.]|nr:hypothetical protein [Aureispira sp.]